MKFYGVKIIPAVKATVCVVAAVGGYLIGEHAPWLRGYVLGLLLTFGMWGVFYLIFEVGEK